MADSELAHLFPNLAAQFDNWDGQAPASDGHDDPSHGGVTDEDVEAYLQQMGSLRAPLNPAVSGQQVPPTPEFANTGRMAPPSHSAYVEEADTSPPPSLPEPVGEEVPEPVPPPQTPAPSLPEYYDIAGRRYSRQQAESWAQFDSLLATNPRLQEALRRELQVLSGQAPPPEPTVTQEARQALAALPPEYQDDEYMKSLHAAITAQQVELQRLSKEARFASETAASQVQRTYSDIARGAISEFQKSRSLDDATMAKVATAAHHSGMHLKYMQGFNPLTGEVTDKDPYKAMTLALETAYFMVPETRDAQVEAEILRRAEQAKREADRKQKLAGISGASGSVPRTQQAVPGDRNQMVEEVTQMFNGSWVGDGS
jgi:hypothetical protein